MRFEQRLERLASERGIRPEDAHTVARAFAIHELVRKKRHEPSLLKAVAELLPLIPVHGAERLGKAVSNATPANRSYTGIVRDARHNLGWSSTQRVISAPSFSIGEFSIVPETHVHPEACWGYDLMHNGERVATIGFNFFRRGIYIENVQGVKGKSKPLQQFSALFGNAPWQHTLAAIVASQAGVDNVRGIRGDRHHRRFIKNNEERFQKIYDATWKAIGFRKTRGRYYIMTPKTKEKTAAIIAKLRRN